jgi:hypothetical protein
MQAGEIERSEGERGTVLKIPGGKLFREFEESYHESNLSSVGRTLRSAFLGELAGFAYAKLSSSVVEPKRESLEGQANCQQPSIIFPW